VYEETIQSGLGTARKNKVKQYVGDSNRIVGDCWQSMAGIYTKFMHVLLCQTRRKELL
jgi:hypothetical protein